MKTKNLLYSLACISFITVIGAAIYEHLVVWPVAFQDLPRSLSAFQGTFKLDASTFWIPIHPITMVLFILALVANRKTERKRFIQIPLVIYTLILAITFIYFVPELMSLVQMTFTDSSDASATSRANTWELLSLIRLGLLITAALILLNGFSKPAQEAKPNLVGKI